MTKPKRIKWKNMPIPAAHVGKDRVKSCLWKRGYLQPEEAWRAAFRTPNMPGHVIEAYKCRHCDLWHVGNRRVDAAASRILHGPGGQPC